MTKEQWFIYLYDIYPSGIFFVFLNLFIVSLVGIGVLIRVMNRISEEENRLILPSFAKPFFVVVIIMLSLLNFLPSKNAILAIVAAPYVVESSETLYESLGDKNSKLYKINKLLDSKLDELLKEHENE